MNIRNLFCTKTAEPKDCRFLKVVLVDFFSEEKDDILQFQDFIKEKLKPLVLCVILILHQHLD